MPRADALDTVDFTLDRRLMLAPLYAIAGLALPAVVLGWLAEHASGAYAVGWGLFWVGANNVAAAWISARGGLTRNGIGIGRVLIALPIRLALLALAIWVGVGPLGLPSKPLALAVIAGEMWTLFLQSWFVLRGPTFVGPLATPADSSAE